MKNEPVVCRLGLVWWVPVWLGGLAFLLGGLELLGTLDGVFPWPPYGAHVACWLGLVFVLHAIWSWRRVTASNEGLLLERVGRRQLVPWSEIGGPWRLDLANPFHDGVRYDPLDDEPDPRPHVNLIVDRDGRLICRVGPVFADRTRFMIAVHRHLRAEDP